MYISSSTARHDNPRPLRTSKRVLMSTMAAQFKFKQSKSAEKLASILPDGQQTEKYLEVASRKKAHYIPYIYCIFNVCI